MRTMTSETGIVALTPSLPVLVLMKSDPAVIATINKAGSPIEYLDAPEFQAYWDADAKVMAEAVKRINSDKAAAAKVYIETNNSKEDPALILKMLNDPEIVIKLEPPGAGDLCARFSQSRVGNRSS